MAGHHEAVVVSSEQLANAKKGWQNFTRASTLGVIAIMGILAGLVAVASLMKWL